MTDGIDKRERSWCGCEAIAKNIEDVECAGRNRR
jgi:hypothetical protein